MALFTYITLLLFSIYAHALKKCVIDETPEYIRWEKKLMLELDRRLDRPVVAPSDVMVVNVTVFVRSFRFDSDTGIMTMQAWMQSKWKDERLQWDPEKHHGINNTDATHFSIWDPYLRISNSEDFLDGYKYYYGYDVKSNGDVQRWHQMLQQTLCNVNLTAWPYDVQECSFELTAVDYSRKSQKYKLNVDFVVIGAQSAEWYISDHKHEKNNSAKIQAVVTFFLMREAVGLSAIVICPVFVLTILSILSLCLDVRRNVRLAIICFSLLGHYYFLTELAYDLPKESEFPPILLHYYRGSVVLSIIIILSTFFLSAMCKFKSTPHHYVKFINDYVYENNYRSYLVFPRWDFDDGSVDNKSSSEDWVKFANIVNSVLIFCVVFAYICLYGTKIPKRTYHDDNNNLMTLPLTFHSYRSM